MDNLIFVILICISIPLVFALAFLEKKARQFVAFMVVGAFVCVFASQLNGILRGSLHQGVYYITTNVTPITEELLKALPILLFAYGITDDRKTLIAVSVAVGLGFAVVENIVIFAQNGVTLSVVWAIKRVCGASLMHGICTAAVGYGISFVRKRKKLFYTGTFALLVLAIVYHSVYNSLIQSDYASYGILLPVLTYIPVAVKKGSDLRRSKKAKES